MRPVYAITLMVELDHMPTSTQEPLLFSQLTTTVKENGWNVTGAKYEFSHYEDA